MINVLRISLIVVLGLAALILAGGTLLSLAAMISLPAGPRPGIPEESIDDAVILLRDSGLSGWELVRRTTNHVDGRFEYCRRNNLQHYRRAYGRGLGFCQQQAFALSHILCRLGFEARPVQSVKCRFENGKTGGHSWVEVKYNGVSRYVDPLLQDPETGRLTFEPLGRVTGFSTLFRIISSWGSSMMNSYVYFTTGSDAISVTG
jgi:hypothetical protein